MVSKHLSGQQSTSPSSNLRVIRHAKVCRKLDISSSKLFDMCAKGIFPKPFTLIPGGRAVGWLEHQVDAWILERQQTNFTEAV
ncbi:MAG: AlpA family phage regulatory protein [Betaproteobacteria bacterium]|nr:AlpA family phage regulatory protein [Betaproteobacteria bacterium]